MIPVIVTAMEDTEAPGLRSSGDRTPLGTASNRGGCVRAGLWHRPCDTAHGGGEDSALGSNGCRVEPRPHWVTFVEGTPARLGAP